MEQANALINVLFVDEFTINVAGIEGRIFRTMPNQDRWSLQVGGFYNWHQPLDIVIRKSEEQLLRIAKYRIEQRFRQLRRDVTKKRKSGVLESNQSPYKS